MNIATLHATVEGKYRFEAFKADAEGNEIPGSRRVVADWFDNLITNNGLDQLGVANAFSANSNIAVNNPCIYSCRVGTGSTPAAFTDTGLVSPLASTITRQADVSGVAATAPYYGFRRLTFRFGTGVAAGNISEVGLFGGTADTVLFSRALTEVTGVPTTITILADETLDVIYEFRAYAPVGDTPWGPVTIAGVDYSGVVRAANVTQTAYTGWDLWIGGWVGGADAGLIYRDVPAGGARTYGTQTLGPVTGLPAGDISLDAAIASSASNTAYTNGTYYRDGTLTWSLNQGNNTGGSFGALQLPTKFGMYQMSFTPEVPKDATKIMTLTFRQSWARYTP